MATHIVSELDDVLEWLDQAEAYHRSQLDSIKEDRRAVQRTRLLHLRQQAAPDASHDQGIGAHAHISAADIAHCVSMREAYTEIACRSGGLLRYHTAAELILAANLSTSQDVRNVAGDLRRRLDKDDAWEHHSPGVYRYRPYAEGHRGPISTTNATSSPRFGGDAGGRPAHGTP